MLLDGDALNQLREEFRSRPTKHPDGFSVDEFVDLMLEKLPVFKDRTSFTKVRRVTSYWTVGLWLALCEWVKG